ncbi:hypothetical protein G7Z17_g4290 [Cylindrodendrum hubeiense]|uniref:Sucrose utilization protein SUC1 n=1 Tax=Cylindrodendrum hubeiense TaxID=595255 RepID=A0A9P5HAY6_9HYPO|nr:hypothetical protein G7Z17_g4290 [Cylindrodendrum hubeiense]
MLKSSPLITPSPPMQTMIPTDWADGWDMPFSSLYAADVVASPSEAMAQSPPPPPEQPPLPPASANGSATGSRSRLARRACDSCHAGPRGLRARTIDKIQRKRHGDSLDSSRAPSNLSDPSNPSKDDRDKGEPSPLIEELPHLIGILDTYAERLFPIWPVVDAADLKRQLLETPSQVNPARHLANAVALAAIAQLRLDTPWQPSVDQAEASGLSERLNLLDALRISFFLHIYHENAAPGGIKSLVYLREAITQAQILRLDRESTYPTLSEADQQVSRRVLWLLFVTERGVALLHKLPIVLKPNILFPWFGGTDDQAQVLPAFLKLVHLFWVFDQSGIFEILRNADSDVPNMATVAQSCLELLQQKLLDSVGDDDWGPINDEFKTFEIATAVIDAMASNHPAASTDQPGPILRRLRDILSSTRGGNKTLLSLLTMKIEAASESGLLTEAANEEMVSDGIIFNIDQQATWQAVDVLTASTDMTMPTYQFMEEQASQISWAPLDLGYLIRSPSPLTRMLLESMPRDAAEKDQTVAC